MNKTNSGMMENAKDKSAAAIQGTGNIVGKTVDSTAQVLDTVVRDTAQVGGEIGTAATGLVKGAIKGTEEIGVGVEHASAAIADGAVKGVGEVGTAIVGTFRKPAIEPAGGNKTEPSWSRN